jgi:hypothetical protein
VLADLILMAPPDDQTTLMANVVAYLGGMALEKCQESAGQSAPFEPLTVARTGQAKSPPPIFVHASAAHLAGSSTALDKVPHCGQILADRFIYVA